MLGSPLTTGETHWFPVAPGRIDNNPTVDYKPKSADLYDSKHGIKMGVASPDCDDAKVTTFIISNFTHFKFKFLE